MNINLEEAHALSKDFQDKYGSTVRGLIINQNIDPEKFLSKIYKVDFSKVEEDKKMVHLLSQIPNNKIIFNNSKI